MVRDTSFEAYQEMARNGMLQQCELKVLGMVVCYGPGTANEMCKASDFGSDTESHGNASLVQKNIHARLNRLSSIGVVRENPKRECGVTGKKAIVWEATGKMPTDPPEEEKKNFVKVDVDSLVKKHFDKMRAINVPFAYQDDMTAWLKAELSHKH